MAYPKQPFEQPVFQNDVERCVLCFNCFRRGTRQTLKGLCWLSKPVSVAGMDSLTKMATRRELKGAAHDVLGWFVSRNNDVGGYWGMGKLYGHALQNNVRSVEIGLCPPCISPDGDQFRLMVSRCSDLIRKYCATRHIPVSWVRQVRVHIEFSIEIGGRTMDSSYLRGDPFECAVELEDDRGRKHIAQHLGWCSPHDPERERRSTRFRPK